MAKEETCKALGGHLFHPSSGFCVRCGLKQCPPHVLDLDGNCDRCFKDAEAIGDEAAEHVIEDTPADEGTEPASTSWEYAEVVEGPDGPFMSKSKRAPRKGELADRTGAPVGRHFSGDNILLSGDVHAPTLDEEGKGEFVILLQELMAEFNVDHVNVGWSRAAVLKEARSQNHPVAKDDEDLLDLEEAREEPCYVKHVPGLRDDEWCCSNCGAEKAKLKADKCDTHDESPACPLYHPSDQITCTECDLSLSAIELAKRLIRARASITVIRKHRS